MMDELYGEVKILEEMINATPCAGKEQVSSYHSQILERLDSGRVIPVSSPTHRNLHQIMWMVGYRIYNHLRKGSEIDFIGSDERKRFDMWYVSKYILERKLTPLELRWLRDAALESFETYHHPLEDLGSEALV
jgi:hypothetical protein